MSRVLIVTLLAVASACGGKPRVVPPSQTSSSPGGTAPARDRSAGTQAGARIRILLCEDFTQLEVRGARRSSRLWVEVQGDELVLRPTDGSLVERGDGFRLEPAPGVSLSLAGRGYRGSFDVFINPVGRPVLVNEVPVEDYLRGVVPLELSPAAFPFPEAHKAQAVAARTYAVRHLGSQASRGFDVFDDDRSQVYGGLDIEHPLSDQSVGDTRGLIASYAGEPIWALYSSTCGGLTEAFEYAFTGNDSPPYLTGGVACDDRLSRYHRWTRDISGLDLEQALADGGIDIGLTHDIRVVSRTPVGRMASVEIEGSRDRVLLSGPEFRRLLGLRSTAVDGIRLDRDSSGAVTGVEFVGRGWGHGVGLCQMGAVELAREGSSHTEILQHYYQGVDLIVAR